MIFQASADQAAVDFIIPLLLSMTLVMYFNLLIIVVVTCMNAWPTIVLVIPLVWVNIWYQVCELFASFSLCHFTIVLCQKKVTKVGQELSIIPH